MSMFRRSRPGQSAIRRSITVIALTSILVIGLTGCSLSAGDGLTADEKTSTAVATPFDTTTVQPAIQTPVLSTAPMVVYLAAPEGSTGPIGPVGCGNYLVPVIRGEIPSTETQGQIAYALSDLFSIKDQFYGQSGLYNVLYQSNLAVENVTLDNTGHATIFLTGDYFLAGECDDPVFRAQIEYTAQQFSGVSGVSVFINGTAIEEVLSGRGT
jgi:hypothetical protein